MIENIISVFVLTVMYMYNINVRDILFTAHFSYDPDR